MSDTLATLKYDYETNKRINYGAWVKAFLADKVIAALEARIREQDAELAQARAANAELVEALSVLWRWNATDEFDHLEIEQLIYGFATAQQRVYDLVMRYGVQYERSVAQATAQPADGQQQAGGE